MLKFMATMKILSSTTELEFKFAFEMRNVMLNKIKSLVKSL